ncbi:hypothetical protein VTH06DRAFT_7016 [Thermothelomyces fergusii]
MGSASPNKLESNSHWPLGTSLLHSACQSGSTLQFCQDVATTCCSLSFSCSVMRTQETMLCRLFRSQMLTIAMNLMPGRSAAYQITGLPSRRHIVTRSCPRACHREPRFFFLLRENDPNSAERMTEKH